MRPPPSLSVLCSKNIQVRAISSGGSITSCVVLIVVIIESCYRTISCSRACSVECSTCCSI
ncbi:uncharacterized protein LY89DRAFT_58473 [Mollisia scopiformis]|uniref:Uncharacterized protein n=1 Tax=Mollisia scopiformis TaxID=149040 RepID=A0A194XBT7_MOLSC|nr:uncharacterized protein LY89DRAFT_58473 [Mollisia scopiformis]KUJ17628.1 hypothetical protein LY89DRAFT_58473 [Mollisia scopiformis]